MGEEKKKYHSIGVEKEQVGGGRTSKERGANGARAKRRDYLLKVLEVRLGMSLTRGEN